MGRTIVIKFTDVSVLKFTDESTAIASRADPKGMSTVGRPPGLQREIDPNESIRRAAILEAKGMYDAADAVMREAIATFPHQSAISARYTAMALERGDWHGALERSSNMRERFPDDPAGYRDAIDALRELCRIDEAKPLLKIAMEKFGGAPWPLRSAALLAEAQNSTNVAEELWNALHTRFPDDPASSLQRAAFYRRCERFEAADEDLRRALTIFPFDGRIHLAFAQVAGELRNWREADRRYSTALALFPDQANIALQHALVPIGSRAWQEKDFDEALARLRRVQETFPTFGKAREINVRLLRIRDHLDDAAALAQMLMALWPYDAGIGLEYARVLVLQDKRDEAIAYLANLVERTPHIVDVHVDLSAALSRAGRPDEAELACRKAIVLFPYHIAPLVEHANIAMRREAWSEALSRWSETLRLFPAHGEARKGIATARLALAAEIEANGGEPSSIVVPQGDDQGSIANLLMKFESLGASTFGCEFGFVQRKFGAEPTSLLRWAGVNATRLAEGLERRLEGVGTPEQTTLRLPPDKQQDYRAHDVRFSIEWHTFVNRGEMPKEKILRQCCSRNVYLRRKLIEDLEAAAKIFIYRSVTPVPSDELVDPLHAAIRAYGENTLLYVVCGNQSHPAGTVELVRPGLMIGYLTRLSWSEQTGPQTPDFSCWVRICAEACRLHNEASGLNSIVADGACLIN